MPFVISVFFIERSISTIPSATLSSQTSSGVGVLMVGGLFTAIDWTVVVGHGPIVV